MSHERKDVRGAMVSILILDECSARVAEQAANVIIEEIKSNNRAIARKLDQSLSNENTNIKSSWEKTVAFAVFADKLIEDSWLAYENLKAGGRQDTVLELLRDIYSRLKGSFG